MTGAVDYWCNAIGPEREAVWNTAIERQGLSVKVGHGDDVFADLDTTIGRFDRAGFSAVILPVTHPATDAHAFHDFEQVATWPDEIRRLHRDYPGRFFGTWAIDPTPGLGGLDDAAAMIDEPWCVGLTIHTHSWDRRFDHRDYRPFYELAAAHDLPVVMQAGVSGGPFPSECGAPIGIDRPAIEWPDVRFVLSHLGIPWHLEAISMAAKFSNVYLGTTSHPPRRWPAEVLDFIRGAGRTKVLFGTGYPTTGHLRSRDQITELALDPTIESALMGDNARRVFTRLTTTQES